MKKFTNAFFRVLFQNNNTTKHFDKVPTDMKDMEEDLIEVLNNMLIKDGLEFDKDRIKDIDDPVVLQLIYEIMLLYKVGNYKKAVKQIKTGLAHIKTPKDNMTFYNICGLVYYAIGKNKKALGMLDKMLIVIDKEIEKESHDKNFLLNEKARQLCNAGIICKNLGKLDEAYEHFFEALMKHRLIGNKKGEANQLADMGLIHLSRGNLKYALEYQKEAYDIFKSIGYKQGEVIVLGNVGLIYRYQGKLAKALKYLKEVIQLNKEYNFAISTDSFEEMIEEIQSQINQEKENRI